MRERRKEKRTKTFQLKFSIRFFSFLSVSFFHVANANQIIMCFYVREHKKCFVFCSSRWHFLEFEWEIYCLCFRFILLEILRMQIVRITRLFVWFCCWKLVELIFKPDMVSKNHPSLDQIFLLFQNQFPGNLMSPTVNKFHTYPSKFYVIYLSIEERTFFTGKP